MKQRYRQARSEQLAEVARLSESLPGDTPLERARHLLILAHALVAGLEAAAQADLEQHGELEPGGPLADDLFAQVRPRNPLGGL